MHTYRHINIIHTYKYKYVDIETFNDDNDDDVYVN